MHEVDVLYGIAVFLLILGSGFFSGSETAFMAVNRFRLRHLAKTDRRARKTSKILENPEKLLGTLLLCNNLVNVALSALGTAIALALVGERGIIYATLMITLFLLVFGEITPKTIAAYHSDRIALSIAPFILFCIRLFYPVVHLLSSVSSGLIRLLRLQSPSMVQRFTAEEIESLIEESAYGGALKKAQQEMLLGVFMLERTTVGDIMIPIRDVVSLPVDASFAEVTDTVRRTEFSRYPVYEEDPAEVIGFIHVRDLVSLGPDKPFSLRRILRKPHFIPDIRSIHQQFIAFKKRRSHLSFVVDEYGNVVGLLTLEDILEEIVGEIEDEHDRLKREVERLPDGSYHVNGRVLIRDLNRWLDLDLPEGEVRTVAGLIIKELGRIPHPEDRVTVKNYELSISELEGKSILRVRLKLLSGDDRGVEGRSREGQE